MSVARPVRKLYLIWNKTHSPACCACQWRRGGHRRGRILSRPLCFSCLLDSLGRRYPRIVGGSQPCRNLASTFLPAFSRGRKSASATGGKGASLPGITCTQASLFRAPAARKFLPKNPPNVAVISSSIGNGGNRVRNFPNVSIIIGDRIPSSSMN